MNKIIATLEQTGYFVEADKYHNLIVKANLVLADDNVKKSKIQEMIDKIVEAIKKMKEKMALIVKKGDSMKGKGRGKDGKYTKIRKSLGKQWEAILDASHNLFNKKELLEKKLQSL